MSPDGRRRPPPTRGPGERRRPRPLHGRAGPSGPAAPDIPSAAAAAAVYRGPARCSSWSGSTSAPRPGRGLTMAELHVLELTCFEKEDPKPSPRNPDEASLKINGTRVSGPHSMIDGKVLPLNVLHGFTGTVAVTLIE